MDKDTNPQKKNPKRKLKLSKTVILIALLLISTAGAVYFYTQYRDVKNNPEEIARAEVQEVADKAGKLIALPEETPTLATINDKEKLGDQPFFADAQNGDKLLIYTEAKKAIIYRPGENIIVNVGPLVLNTGDQTTETE